MIYIIGDSTAATKSATEKPQSGWGEFLYLYIGVAKEQVINLAINGRSTKSFMDEGRFDELLKHLQKNDIVYIQFGHNDEKQLDPSRYTDPNKGFVRNLIFYIEKIAAIGAIPILLTPLARRNFVNHQLVDTHGEYLASTLRVARDTKVRFIDINKYSVSLLERMGEENSVSLFNHLEPEDSKNYPQGSSDNTHFSPLGAHVFANAIATETSSFLLMPIS